MKRLIDYFDELPLGFAPLAMVLLLLISAPIAMRRGKGYDPGDVVFWVFAKTHADEYAARLDGFEGQFPGHRLVPALNSLSVMVDKMLASFLSGTGAPDVFEVEVNAVSRFFAGRPSDCGFVDLRPYLERDGLYDAVVTARYSAWSNRERIYGVPHDIHPVVLLYRADLTEPYGDLPSEVKTWDDFVRFFQKPGILDRNKDGKQDRFAVILDGVSAWHVRTIALQQEEGLFDGDGNVTFDGPWNRWAMDFVRSALFETRIAKNAAPMGQDMYASLDEGEAICAICPDWLLGFMAKDCPTLTGKLKGMPLPAVAPGGRRTSTMGGTMIGITKQAKDKELAWQTIKHLYYNDEALANRFRKTRILPPVKSCWKMPVFDEREGFLADPPLGQLLIQASDVPRVYSNRYLAEAGEEMNKACSIGIKVSKEEGEEALKRSADRIRELVRRDRFVGEM